MTNHAEKPILFYVWEHGDQVPLQDEDSAIDHSRWWLRDVLGLNEGLIADLYQWSADMELHDRKVESAESTRQPWLEQSRVFDIRARDLVARLRVELGDRYEIEYSGETAYSHAPACWSTSATRRCPAEAEAPSQCCGRA